MNALILMAALTSGQCSGDQCALVTPHDVSVAFAGTTGLSHHRQIAPVRRTVHYFRHQKPLRRGLYRLAVRVRERPRLRALRGRLLSGCR